MPKKTMSWRALSERGLETFRRKWGKVVRRPSGAGESKNYGRKKRLKENRGAGEVNGIRAGVAGVGSETVVNCPE